MIKIAHQETRHIRAYFETGVEFVLRHISGQCALSELFNFELTLLHGDARNPVSPDEVIGRGVTVMIDMPEGGEKQEYYGCIREIRQVGWSDEGITYRAIMVPAMWFLTQRNNCRIFHELETSDIVEKVLRDAGIEDFEFNLSNQYTPREYCVQYRETDFNFVSRLLEEDGIFYYFKHENGKHILMFCDSASNYYDLEITKLHFPKPGQNFPNRKELLTWNESFQFIPGSVSQKDFNFKEPQTDLFRKRVSTVKLPNSSNCEVFDYHGRFADGKTGVHRTDVRMGELEKSYQTGFSSSHFAFIRPAGKFTFGVHCIEERKGQEYVITGLQFEARATDYLTGENQDHGKFYENKFTCIPADRVFRPSRRAEKPFVQGPQTAIVTTDGSEIMVDGHGRVKVQFHWDRYGQFDDNSSCWIRVSQTHAGQGWGEMDIPRQNEEVIVSFIEGDPDRPIITGRVYNGINRPPFALEGEDNEANKTRRGGATQTVGGGGFNEMSMDDTPGEEQIRINSQHNLDTNVGNNETHAVGVDIDSTIGNNETRSVGVDQSLTVGANRTVNVTANHTETIGAAQTVNVGADQVNTIGATQRNNISANQSNSIGATQSNQIGLANNTMVGAIANEMVGFTKTVNVGVAMNTIVGALNAEQVGGIKSITAGRMIKLQTPGGSITIDAAGCITLQGTKVLIDSTGPVKVNGSVIDLN